EGVDVNLTPPSGWFGTWTGGDDIQLEMAMYRACHRVVCVKFSNLIVVLGDASGEPPVSVAAVTARWVDCLQLLEVELGNGLELLRQPRPFETGRQVVQPSAVFVP
ncbi:MAG TPA: hypothetical protein VK898_07845, partial [Chloroflexota bacterium]|nr:hypothetical protein [Chloroflexota bacterium]